MATVKIETLTPVHIGSVKDLSAETEYIQIGNEIGIIDEEKVLSIIGAENIDKWVVIINKNESLKDYLKQRKPDFTLDNVAKRKLDVYGSEVSKMKTLKEQMHNGAGVAYIPGSSIKGAIRTAVLAELVRNEGEIDSKLLKNFKGKYSGEKIEKKFFGGDPNNDVFRFLRVRDAHFEDSPTIAIKQQVLNLYGRKWDFKKGSDHLVECFNEKQSSIFDISVDQTTLEKYQDYDPKIFNIKELFETINKNTALLLSDEIAFWEDESGKAPLEYDHYIDKLNELHALINVNNNKEAILRVGFGSGWDFITGAWVKEDNVTNDLEYKKIKETLRDRNYLKYPFPKTRKFDERGSVLGFVKLTLLD